MTTPPDLPTLDALHAAAPSGDWAPYSYEGQSASGRHKHSLCTNTVPLKNPDHRCLGELYSGKGGTEADARALVEYVAALHNAYPSLSARIRELEEENAKLRAEGDILDASESAELAKILDAPARVVPVLRELLKRTPGHALSSRIEELEAQRLGHTEMIAAMAETIGRLEETLRGIRQEKLKELDETQLATKERIEQQVAWIDRVLRGEP